MTDAANAVETARSERKATQQRNQQERFTLLSTELAADELRNLSVANDARRIETRRAEQEQTQRRRPSQQEPQLDLFE
ncbi:hypothetical protein [Nesterenkonia aerolata]|uniref:Uncharacterized protein n=1 Tax=Nesterenkonia aerolata TaxID=3074079 RepID=A0ABU2DSS2_9MICC|nr:hypothetical protein [Nesterenkonia sp. LY-0111]MDR8019345.1 hypothetical protein [Nesterenkonia sp. LY-0111]